LLLTESSCEDFIKPYAENRSFGFLTSQMLELLEKKFVQKGWGLDDGDEAILRFSLEFPVLHEAFKLVEEVWLDIWYSAITSFSKDVNSFKVILQQKIINVSSVFQ
jgi:hypothetical protein